MTAWLGEHRPESGPATIVHGDYRLGNTMFAPDAPARLVAIFDWELATIGDPLADVGYLLATWAQPGDEENAIGMLGGITRRPGFPTRDELIARYEAGSGRSMSDVRWYMTLALWKSAVFLEGSYKRRLAGTTDDPFFDLLEIGVPADRGPGMGDRVGLIVDYGGVLTTDVFASFRAFCAAEGLEPEAVRERFMADPTARELLAELERGRLAEAEFERRFAAVLEVEPAGLVDRLFGGMRPDEAMLDGVRAARRAGDPHRRCCRTPGDRTATTARPSPSCSTPWSSRARWGCASRSRRSTS